MFLESCESLFSGFSTGENFPAFLQRHIPPFKPLHRTLMPRVQVLVRPPAEQCLAKRYKSGSHNQENTVLVLILEHSPFQASLISCALCGSFRIRSSIAAESLSTASVYDIPPIRSSFRTPVQPLTSSTRRFSAASCLSFLLIISVLYDKDTVCGKF